MRGPHYAVVFHLGRFWSFDVHGPGPTYHGQYHRTWREAFDTACAVLKMRAES